MLARRDPSNDAYAYFFSAIAYFNLNQLPEVEERALKAEEIDKEHNQPLLQFLLAQIYETKQDSTAAAVHFRECRKLGAGFKQPEEGIIRSAKSKVDSPRQFSACIQHEPASPCFKFATIRNSRCRAVHCGPPLGSAMEG
jgi:tetratricopeptide (TPR) repeat protein